MVQEIVEIVEDSLALVEEQLIGVVDSQVIEVATGQIVSIAQVPVASHTTMVYGLLFSLIFMLALAFFRLSDGELFRRVTIGIFSYSNTSDIVMGGFTSFGTLIILLAISYASMAIGFGFAIDGEFFSVSTLLIFIVLLASHFAVITLARFIGWSFNSSNIATQITSNLWVCNIAIGILSAPLVAALFFVKPSNYLIVAILYGFILVYMTLSRYFRGVKILFDNRVFISYIILSLCTLEIVPLFVIIKIVGRWLAS